VVEEPIFFAHGTALLDLASKARLPTMHELRRWPEHGALMSYGRDLHDLFYRSASYVDRILKGAKPADLPVEQPTKFELVLNFRTAKALGISVPDTLLARADEVITLVGSVSLAWPLVARAQQPERTHRIGILSPGRSELPDPTLNMLNSFLQGLHKLGYTEGENLIIERQYANGSADQLRELAAELVRRKPDIIFAFSTKAARPAKQATSKIPIIA
jgi:ABC-type uncharacterized transport system substrate-binding protein